MIIGIDPSINAVGVCFLGDKSVKTMTIRSKPGMNPWLKMNEITKELDDIFFDASGCGNVLLYGGIEWPAEYNWHESSVGLCRLWYAVGRIEEIMVPSFEQIRRIPINKLKAGGKSKKDTVREVNLAFGLDIPLNRHDEACAVKVADFTRQELRMNGVSC